MDAVLSFVEAGLGIAVIPSMVLQDRPKLCGVPFAPPIPIRIIAPAQEFRATLLQLLSGANEQGDLPAGVEFIVSSEPSGDQSGHSSTSSDHSPGPSSSNTTRQASPSE
jgi:hypothetical protein